MENNNPNNTDNNDLNNSSENKPENQANNPSDNSQNNADTGNCPNNPQNNIPTENTNNGLDNSQNNVSSENANNTPENSQKNSQTDSQKKAPESYITVPPEIRSNNSSGNSSNGGKKNSNTVFIIIAVLLIVFACLCAAVFAGSVYLFTKGDSNLDINPIFNEATDVPREKNTPEPDSTSIPDDLINAKQTPSVSGPLELTDNQKNIISAAERIRGLSLKDALVPNFQTRDDLKKYILNNMEKNSSDQDFADEQGLLTILGLIEPGMDLKKFYADLYSEQIAGFFDEDTATMYLVEGGSDAENSKTLAHEYTHALQYFNFVKTGKLQDSDEYCKTHSEDCLAISDLMEGDATLTESFLSNDKKLNLGRDDNATDISSSVFENAPKYFQQSLVAPYNDGFNFVYYYYLRGGFSAINKIYENPPTSIEQILHPEKYQKDEPVDVTIESFDNVIGKKCELVTNDVINEEDLLWTMDSGVKEDWRLSEKNSAKAAAGWGGGRYQYARCDGQNLFFAKTVWDSEKEAQEFYDGMKEYSDKRWGKMNESGYWINSEGERSDLVLQNDLVFWIVTPSNFDPAQLLEMINGGGNI